MTKQTTLASYSNFTKGWLKALGPMVVAEALDTVHALGARPGKQALAIAMMQRDTGATSAQIVLATGAPQLNKMRALVEAGYFKRVPMPQTDAGHMVYKLELTGKGATKVKAAAEKAAKAAADAEAPEGATKPKGKGKVRAASKRKPKAAPVTEAPVNEPEAPQPQVTNEAPEAPQPQA